ncbi:microbial collagenase [Kitasatospora sp. GAS204A]|uniref:collagenase n=1 Tax=unclassified Kitasatospora TaxID=2633591 RepID=UPI0024765241|nr:collagenase [Kitasatospora sp. GAS204B]MDH6115884.1 microbial collagenase [Kitasatospora sp. GAS204B]
MSATSVGKQLPRLLIAALALTAGLGLAAPPSEAHAAPAGLAPAKAAARTPAARPGLAPQPAAGAVRSADDAQRVSAKDRPPLPSDNAALHRDVGKPAHPMSRAATAACDTSAISANTGDALVQAVEAAGSDCVNTFFTVAGSAAHQAFQESQLTTVANALAAASPSYPGDDSTHVLELVLYLRAGYYVQWNDAADVGTYGSGLQSAIQAALDAFYASPHSQDVTDANGAVLSEAVTLIDSAGQNARYLPVEQRLLTGYNSTYNSSAGMLAAVNNVYTVLFRGHQNADFVAATEADPSILTTLDTFATGNLALLGGAQSYLDSNAGTELARFLQDATLAPTVRPLLKGLLADSAMTGPTAPLWVGVAAQADQYDQSNCADYNTCDLAAKLQAAVLTINYTCDANLRIVAQDLTADELNATCNSLIGETAFFHNLIKDPGPVADDGNTTLEVDVFHSTADYQTYAGEIFGVSTDNGGEYIEGEPNQAGNQPRFVAYEADWLRPTFQIWNLNHEFTHYLDGRFDTYGDFTAATSTADTIWWIEGLAEYDSYTYRGLVDTDAVADAAKGSYPLSTVFANTYSSGEDRVYPWGYLSVRYMLERHRSDVDALLGFYRSGDYQGALNLLTSIGTGYDADWSSWLAACAAGACNTVPQPPTAAFTAQASGLAATFADSSTAPDGTITARTWDFGDGTGSTDANPTKTYTTPGVYTVHLTVLDSQGASAATTSTVTVSAAAPECTGADARELGQNCTRSGLAADAGNSSYLYLDIPAGTPSLTITTTPGSGSADLYYSGTGWATAAGNSASATGPGAHTLTIANPPAGANYISLQAISGFTGATVTTSY